MRSFQERSEDSNSPYLCKELRFLGVEVKRMVTLPDEIEVIGRHVHEYSRDYTWVFTTGGVGPTHDDVTIEAVAHGFGAKPRSLLRCWRCSRDIMEKG